MEALHVWQTEVCPETKFELLRTGPFVTHKVKLQPTVHGFVARLRQASGCTAFGRVKQAKVGGAGCPRTLFRLAPYA